MGFNFEDIPIGEGSRRLPIYLLLDTSGSMQGPAIDALNDGIKQLVKEVKDDTEASQTIHIGLIEFNDTARMLTNGLVSIDDFSPPKLFANGYTKLGDAFNLLNESLDKDVIQNVPGQKKGDWKPLVYVLTDGEPYPDHNWRGAREKLLSRSKSKLVNIVTVGCGPNINDQTIKEISTGPAFKMSDSSGSFKEFFKWVTQTAIMASKALSQSSSGNDVNFTPPPPPPSVQNIQFTF